MKFLKRLKKKARSSKWRKKQFKYAAIAGAASAAVYFGAPYAYRGGKKLLGYFVKKGGGSDSTPITAESSESAGYPTTPLSTTQDIGSGLGSLGEAVSGIGSAIGGLFGQASTPPAPPDYGYGGGGSGYGYDGGATGFSDESESGVDTSGGFGGIPTPVLLGGAALLALVLLRK